MGPPSSMVAKNERASTKKQRSSDIIRDTSEPEFLAEMQKVGKGKDALILAELLLWLRILFQLVHLLRKQQHSGGQSVHFCFESLAHGNSLSLCELFPVVFL